MCSFLFFKDKLKIKFSLFNYNNTSDIFAKAFKDKMAFQSNFVSEDANTIIPSFLTTSRKCNKKINLRIRLSHVTVTKWKKNEFCCATLIFIAIIA